VSVRVTREYPVFCCVVSVGGLLLAGCLPCLPACLPHPSHPVPSQVLPASSVICHHCHWAGIDFSAIAFILFEWCRHL